MNENKDDYFGALTKRYCDQIIRDLPMLVKKYRDNNDISQEQFAQDTGLSRSTIARVETKGKISLKTFIAIQFTYLNFFSDSNYREYREKFEKEADIYLKNKCID